MKLSRKTYLAPLTLLLLTAPLLRAQQDDVETRALRDEMQRSMKDLHLEAMDRPYFIAYKIADTDRKEAQANFGSLTASSETHSRTLYVTVRVGSYEFDNGNFSGGGGGLAAILTSLVGGLAALPVDDNYDELRRKIWLATDAAYKKAVEDLSAKKAAEQSRNREDTVPDFSKEAPLQESEALPSVDEKLSDAEHLVRTASAVFRKLPLVQSSEADFTITNVTEHFLNSEGTAYIRRIPEVYFHASASLQNTTGEVFSDSYSAFGRSMSDLPSEAEVLLRTTLVADRLSERRKGKVAKRYNGPVLFEDQAAVELFAHDFANQLSARRAGSGGGTNALAALLSPGSGASSNAVNMVNKVGSRVLPDFLTVVDNPQLTQSDGHPLLGNYKFDEEGVPAREIVLVKDGILKTLLTSRTPVRGMLHSTGSMRERGVLPGNLLVDASQSSSTEDLKKRLLELVAARSLDYGYIIRRLSNNTALEAIRVYPDGHQDTVRDARIAEITIASFKDILAASKERTVYTEQAPINGLAGLTVAGGDLITYVVPNLLFEDMTVEHVPNDSPKLPDIPSPLASN
jgi:predicted Zn-dependent protease